MFFFGHVLLDTLFLNKEFEKKKRLHYLNFPLLLYSKLWLVPELHAVQGYYPKLFVQVAGVEPQSGAPLWN